MFGAAVLYKISVFLHFRKPTVLHSEIGDGVCVCRAVFDAAMNETSSGTSFSTHLWVCDREGRVFVLQNAGATTGSIRARRAAPTPPLGGENENHTKFSAPEPVPVRWSKVDGGVVRLDEVLCGHSGVVLGRSVSPSILYMRRGVSGESPTGDCWSKCLCSASAVAVGDRYIVRSTASGVILATSVEVWSVTSRPVFMPSWTALPRCSSLDKFERFALDAQDNLYIISHTGEVYGYFGLETPPTELQGETEQLGWRLIANAPKVPQSRGFSLFGLWRRDNDEEMFSNVCAGRRSLWCLCRGSSELWQLVLGSSLGRSDGGEREVRTNWVKFGLPKDDHILHCCADKVKTDALYGIATGDQPGSGGEKIVSYSVLQENSGRLELTNPLSWTRPWRSIALNCTELKTPARTYPSLYPSLPKLDFDLCCENGDCEFCTRKAREDEERGADSMTLQRSGGGEEEAASCPSGWRVGGERGGGGGSVFGVGRKRRRRPNGEDGEGGPYFTGVMFQPKRARHLEEGRRFLLEGVEVGIRSWGLGQQGSQSEVK